MDPFTSTGFAALEEWSDHHPPKVIEVQRDHLVRFYYFESQIVNWIGISLAMVSIGSLVHLNLNYIIGAILMFIAALNMLFTLYGYYIWIMLGDHSVQFHIVYRRKLFRFQFALMFIWTGFTVWAGILMIIRNS